MDSSRNIFTWLSRPRQTTAASDSSPRVPQSSSDSTTVPSPCGLVVSLELEQRGSEASGPAEALRSSPSKEDKAKSDAGGDTKEQESEGGEDGASDKGDRNESEKEKDHKEEDDCAALINIKTAEVNVQEKEGSKEKSGQTEFKAAKLMVKEDEESEENLLQGQCKVKKPFLEVKEECGEKPRQNERKVAEAEVKGKEISTEKPEQTECKRVKAKLKVKDYSEEDSGQSKCKVEKVRVKENDESVEKLHLVEDAKQKMKEKEESKEKPGQTKSKVKKEEVSKEKSGQTKSKATKEKVKKKTDSTENARQFECKFYSSPEGCKFGKVCKFSHKKTNSVPPPVGLNFMGLPIRPGVKDCPSYMLTGACKADTNCKFNHPDPTPVIDEPSVQDGHGECSSSKSAQNFPVWSSQGIPNKTTPFVPMEYSATHPYTEWSPYEVPVNPVPQPPSPAYIVQSSASESCIHESQERWPMIDKDSESDHLGHPQHDFRSKYKDHMSFHENPKAD